MAPRFVSVKLKNHKKSPKICENKKDHCGIIKQFFVLKTHILQVLCKKILEYLRFMEKVNKKKLIIPFIVSLLFLAVTFNTIAQGIEKNEIWRIVVGGLGGSWFLFVAIISGIMIFKKDKNTA